MIPPRVLRILAFILITLGTYLLACDIHDEYRGLTTKPVGPWGSRSPGRYNHSYLYSVPVSRENNPELFREFMMVHWAYAWVIAASGCILCLRGVRDRSDGEDI
jgi:hypothetical protein